MNWGYSLGGTHLTGWDYKAYLLGVSLRSDDWISAHKLSGFDTCVEHNLWDPNLAHYSSCPSGLLLRIQPGHDVF